MASRPTPRSKPSSSGVGEVVTLSGRRDDGGPYCSGEALCLACGHDWVAVAPAGTTRLECPSCKLTRGAYRHSIGPADGDRVFQCACGAEEFFFKQSANDGRTLIVCTGCGDFKSIDAVFPT